MNTAAAGARTIADGLKMGQRIRREIRQNFSSASSPNPTRQVLGGFRNPV
jgi:hypothetical protein